jgi:hypothetical protein
MAKEGAMKKLLGALLLLIAGISAYYLVRANPIPNPRILINELAFTPNGWVMEIEFPDTGYTNQCRIISRRDTAYFKPMAVLPDTLYLIAQESLSGQLRIDSTGDDLTIQSDDGLHWYGNLEFGSSSLVIAAPEAGQSICYLPELQSYYLDNTPTLGYQNDTINATGYLAGWVKNSGLPLQGAKVASLDNKDSTITDGDGYFIIPSAAERKYFKVSAQNFVSQTLLQQLWPESTVVVNVNLAVSVEKIIGRVVPKSFEVSEPFPNPFNPETQVQYTLPQKRDVAINAYDISGKLVDKIFSGYQSSGSYRARWNAVHAPSGVYIIQIRAGQTGMSKKCVLVK